MKKILFASTLFLSTGLGTLAQQSGASRLYFKTEIHDFGELAEGPAFRASFDFKNITRVPLTLQVYTTCGCTVAEYPTVPVLPDSTAAVSVTYHTQGRPGPFEKTILVQSTAGKNGPDTEEYQLKIRGFVKAAK